MKKTIFMLAGIISAGIAFDGCKKGPDDPFISILHSRKAKVVGDWKLTGGTETDVNNGTSTTLTDDGSNQTNATSGNKTFSDAHTVEYKFDKKGGYTSTEHRVHIDVTTVGTTTSTETKTTDDTRTGTWNFTDGVGAPKNKEQITLVEGSWTNTVSDRILIKTGSTVNSDNTTNTATSETYTGNPGWSGLWDIDGLHNKKMIIKVKNTYITTGTSSTMDASWTFEQ